MAVENIIAIAILSGKGGVGKSVISLNLALGLGKLGIKTLLFDAGGGNLVYLTNNMHPEMEPNKSAILPIADNVDLYTSIVADSNSLFDDGDIERLLSEIVEVTPEFQCILFDCFTGSGPVPYTLAGLSELSLMVTTPDPTAVAGTYLLARSLYQDGLATRSGLLFNMVESADEAASLKTRFDILTGKFLSHQFEQAGYIRNDSLLAESVLEQQPLLSWRPESRSGLDFLNLSKKMRLEDRLQFETDKIKSQQD
ncbi:MAG: MinD/ParA family protein [candidate division Zixibacteria bacterium]|nr:MinD/ParA family protein [candidate division Zixibacteria bacterium]